MSTSKSAKRARPVAPASVARKRTGSVGSRFDDCLRETGDYEAVTSKAFENVWAALEPPDVAIGLKIRAQLMRTLRRYIADNAMTPAIAARRMKAPKSRIVALSNGDINAFNVEALLGMAQAVGFKLDLKITS